MVELPTDAADSKIIWSCQLSNLEDIDGRYTWTLVPPIPKLLTPILSALSSGQGCGSVGTFKPVDVKGTVVAAQYRTP